MYLINFLRDEFIVLSVHTALKYSVIIDNSKLVMMKMTDMTFIFIDLTSA